MSSDLHKNTVACAPVHTNKNNLKNSRKWNKNVCINLVILFKDDMDVLFLDPSPWDWVISHCLHSYFFISRTVLWGTSLQQLIFPILNYFFLMDPYKCWDWRICASCLILPNYILQTLTKQIFMFFLLSSGDGRSGSCKPPKGNILLWSAAFPKPRTSVWR